MAAVGCINPFDKTTEDIEAYFVRVDAYLTVNAVADDAKVSTLITLLGARAHEKLRTACQPNTVATTAYDDCKAALVARYKRPNLTHTERLRLGRRLNRP
jgi:hypothetical protein